MRISRLLAALPLFLPVPALAQWTSGVHDTGVVRFEVFDNGKLGAFYDGDSSSIGTGFLFEGVQGLFEGALLVGDSPEQVSGEIWDWPDLEWATVAPVEALFPPGLGVEAYEAAYDDSASPNPIGLRVTQRSISREGDPFVFVEFTVENVSGGDLYDLYFGIFADWRIGEDFSQYGEYEPNTQLIYEMGYYDGSNFHFGTVAVDDPTDLNVSGASVYTLPGDSLLYWSLTNFYSWCQHGHCRPILGVGPHDLVMGAMQAVTFALVGGASFDELVANAELAHQGFGCLPSCVATEPSAEDVGVAFHASPNPARGATTLSFALDRPQPIRLSLLDALGREVAVLVEGERAAGAHAVTWEAAGLPAGVYLARLTVGGATHTRTITLLR